MFLQIRFEMSFLIAAGDWILSFEHNVSALESTLGVCTQHASSDGSMYAGDDPWLAGASAETWRAPERGVD